jgi:hypothetical protein
MHSEVDTCPGRKEVGGETADVGIDKNVWIWASATDLGFLRYTTVNWRSPAAAGGSTKIILALLYPKIDRERTKFFNSVLWRNVDKIWFFTSRYNIPLNVCIYICKPFYLSDQYFINLDNSTCSLLTGRCAWIIFATSSIFAQFAGARSMILPATTTQRSTLLYRWSKTKVR